MNVKLFTAGNGNKFALVSREYSGQVVVFTKRAEKWVGCCEFNQNESAGIWPGTPIDEVLSLINYAEQLDSGGHTV